MNALIPCRPFWLVALLLIALMIPADALSFATAGKTIHVPADHAKIQDAINAAGDGDTVLVADGTYSGNGNRDLDFKGKNLTVTSQNGPTKTIIDCGGYDSADGSGNHRGFYIHSGEKVATISGFTVKNGYTTYISSVSSDPYSYYGGGICIVNDSASKIILSNCNVSGNSGSGVYNYNYGGTIILTDCTISGNSGGGVGNDSYSGTISLTNCNVSGNSGSGVYNENYSGTITSGTITLNNCNVSGNSGSGVYNYNYGGTITLNNCTISGNNALYGSGGGVYNENYDGTITLNNCTISGNNALYGGGGVSNGSYSSKGTITLTNCTISGNNAQIGGGVYIDSYSGMISLTNCNVSGNSGSGVYNYNYGGPITLTNCIFYKDIGGEIVNDLYSNANAIATFSDIQGSYPGSNNIDADPQFVNAAAGDLHLQSGSPCLGKGTPNGAPATDLDGNPRPNPPSMGAYELAIPAILVTNAKLGQPQFVGSPVSGSCAVVIPLYLKGAVTGTAHVSGHWIYKGQSISFTADTEFPAIGDWSPAGSFSIPWPEVQGNWELQFVVDRTNVLTGVVRASVTGFHPSVNGWKFGNYFPNITLDPRSFYSWSGLCLGMSREAAVYYRNSLPVPQDSPHPSKNTYTTIVGAHVVCNAHYYATDLPRSVLYSSDNAEISTEINRISQHLSAGQPWVMALRQSRSLSLLLPQGGHAVVATGMFDCLNVYYPGSEDKILDDQEFSVYDPNEPGMMRYVDIFDKNGQYSMDFVPFGSLPVEHMHYPVEYSDNFPNRL